MSLGLFLLLYFCLCFIPPPASPASTSAFTCPFTLTANRSIDLSNRADEMLRREVTEEEFDEELAALVWCLPKTYVVERPPFLAQHDSTSLNLAFTFDIREISEIDDRGQHLSIPMYFSVAWLESRLWINQSSPAWDERTSGPKDEVTEDPNVLKDLWVPDLEVYGLENFDQKSVLKGMSGLRIKKNKTIDYNARVTITLSCRMVFDDYPFDTQDCIFQVGSYYYFKDIVTCTSVFKDPDSSRQRNLQFEITFHELDEELKTVEVNSGVFAACGFRIHLERKRHQLIFQIYLPCILFVCVSWVSFLIRPAVVPGRMALLVTLFLILVNTFNNVRSMAPTSASSQLNAIDLYLVVCIFMVFLALVEYGIVLFAISMREGSEITEKKHLLKAHLSHTAKDAHANGDGDSGDHHIFNDRAGNSGGELVNHREDIRDLVNDINLTMARKSPRRALLASDSYKLGGISLRKVDLIALVLLPSLFIVFNIGYWAHYLILLQNKQTWPPEDMFD